MAKLISADLTNNKLCILEYTTNNRKMLSFKEDKFDAKIVSHTYTDIGKIIFDRPITKIGEKAFYWRFSLTSVTIPDSVTMIGVGAFNGCINLKEFKGKFATDGGRCLIMDNTIIAYVEASGTTYTIPENVTMIGVRAFSDCSSLTSVTIHDSVTNIGDGAFSGCRRLTSVIIPDSVTRIGDYAFNGCDSLKSVTIPDSVTTIGDNAFYECHRLTSVIIPDSVTRIGDKVFQNCIRLTSVTIGDRVTIIGDYAFNGCSSLKEFKGKFAVDGGRCLIVYGVLNAFAIGCGVTQYTIPNNVTTIEDYAFSHCSSLKSVTIGDSVTRIGNCAFYSCRSLNNVTIGKGVSNIGKSAFKECNIDTIVCYPKIPPKIDDSFGKFENLIVPTGCEEAYANSDWGKYLK